jgi:hypothetical protein
MNYYAKTNVPRKLFRHENHTGSLQGNKNILKKKKTGNYKPSLFQDSSGNKVSVDTDTGKDNDDTYGVVTTTSKQSVQEYFAQKMAKLQRSRAKESESPETGNADCDNKLGGSAWESGVSCELGVRFENIDEDYGDSFANRIQSCNEHETSEKSEEMKDRTRKRKTGKKTKMMERIDDEETGDLGVGVDSEALEPSRKKRKKDKKSKKSTADDTVDDDVEEIKESVAAVGKKKKGKVNLKDSDGVESVEGDCVVETSRMVKRDARVENVDENVEGKVKKRKKNGEKVKEGNVISDVAGSEESGQQVKKKKKKKKKRGKVVKKTENVDVDSGVVEMENSSDEMKRKRGRRKKQICVASLTDPKYFNGSNILDISGYRHKPVTAKKKARKIKTANVL